MVAALVCRSTSHTAVRHVLPHSGNEHLPALTQTLVTGVVDGRFPLVPIATVLSSVIVVSGLYVIFSKRLSPDTMASAFALLCCVAYSAGVVLIGSTMMAIVLPFLATATRL